MQQETKTERAVPGAVVAVAAAAAVAATALGVAATPVLAGMSLNHNETLVR